MKISHYGQHDGVLCFSYLSFFCKFPCFQTSRILWCCPSVVGKKQNNSCQKPPKFDVFLNFSAKSFSRWFSLLTSQNPLGRTTIFSHNARSQSGELTKQTLTKNQTTDKFSNLCHYALFRFIY